MTNLRIRNASLDTEFGRASDQLSRIVSELIQIQRYEEDCFEDMEAYHAPSECYGDLRKAIYRKLDALCEKHQMTRMDMYELISDRTSSKWIYNNIRMV